MILINYFILFISVCVALSFYMWVPAVPGAWVDVNSSVGKDAFNKLFVYQSGAQFGMIERYIWK